MKNMVLTSVLLALTTTVLGGCHYAAPYVKDYRELDPAKYVMVMAKGRDKWPCIVDFVSYKSDQGYEVEILTFDPTKKAKDRCLEVQRALTAAEPAEGQLAYVLFVARASELSMGPWKFEGVERKLRSDAPYFLGSELWGDKEIKAEQWERILSRKFPWIAGRIPYSSKATVAAILDSSKLYSARMKSPERKALLGAERFVVWHDSSLILSKARNALLEVGWDAHLCATEWPADEIIGPDRERQGKPGNPKNDFVNAWVERAPHFIYTLSHGGMSSIGSYLLSVAAVKEIGPKKPAKPAMLFSSGCSSGLPSSSLVEALFRRQWICAFGGFMDLSSPLPLIPALTSEINVSRVAASGLPMGLVLRVIREIYIDQSAWTWTFWLVPRVRTDFRVNCLATIFYGDPSVSYNKQSNNKRPSPISLAKHP